MSVLTWSSASEFSTAWRTRSACCAGSRAGRRPVGGCSWKPSESRATPPRIEVHEPGDVYRGDDYTYWGFGAGGLTALATHAGFARVTINATPTIDGHPRILATLERPGA